MNPKDYTDVELGLFARTNLECREITLTEEYATLLVRSGHYRKSTGAPFGGTHYRRSNADGSCLHLVWRDDKPYLHRDTFDPHASPLSMYMHLTHEARFETASVVAQGWSLIKLLAR